MISRRRILSTLLAAALLGSVAAPGVAAAVTDQLKAKISAAKDDVKISKKALKDDEKDLKAIEKIVQKWHDAWHDHNDKKLAKADEDLLAWLQEELAENREDRQRARRELIQAGGNPDAGPPRRPARGGARQRPGQGGARRGQPAQAGGPAAADAQTDLEAEREDFRRTREIATELRELQRRFTAGTAGPQVHQQKSDLLHELVRSARQDVRRATQELTEDETRLDRLKARR